MSDNVELFFNIFNSIDFEKIKDHPNILIAANFWEEERYLAACTCYKFMRTLDDLIDEHKADNPVITSDNKKLLTKNAKNWIKSIYKYGNEGSSNKELVNTIKKFRIPRWPLENFVKSMIYDINNNGFKNLGTFLEYSQGASVAPASIFVHLTGIQQKGNYYSDPPFNVKDAATPCAIFSYLVHIIRDFCKDQLNNLNYFADDIIQKHGLTREDLYHIAKGSEIKNNFREMMKEYYLLADSYREKTWNILNEITPLLSPRYQLSLEIIFDLYLMVFERINIQEGSFSTSELNPSPSETRERVYNRIMAFVGN